MSSKNISVKVSVAKIVSALEAKAKESKTALAEIKKLSQAYEVAVDKWKTAYAKAIVKAGAVTSADRRWPYNPNEYEVTVKIPGGTILPEKPETPELPSSPLTPSELVEVENAIRILKMTDEEYVSASVFKNLSRFL